MLNNEVTADQLLAALQSVAAENGQLRANMALMAAQSAERDAQLEAALAELAELKGETRPGEKKE